MKTSSGIAACLLLLVFSSGARAEQVSTWFNLAPEAALAVVEAPFEGFFYSRAAAYQGAATLTEPYVLDAGTASAAELPAGTMLYAVRTHTTVYFCSAKIPRQETAGELAGTVLKAALGFGLFALTSRAASSQCFRDTDKDGRFDEVAIGTRSYGALAHNQRLDDAEKLATPVAYRALDDAAVPAPLTVGLMGEVRDLKAGRFRVSACMRSAPSDFSTAELYCFPYQETGISSLPAKVDFLDGEITIEAIAPDASGAARIRYTVSKPVAAKSVLIITDVAMSSAFVHRLLYSKPR